jgi:NAD(P)-dependent dehydrogenase (short-subunit alcohol dehydrogenase family)
MLERGKSVKNLFDLTGKTAVVIGGNSTLGSEMAIGLAEHGANIAIVGRNKETSLNVVKQLVKLGVKAEYFYADVVDKTSLEKSCKEIAVWSDGFDILINAPGKNSDTPFFELEMDEWDDIMNVNLKGIVLSCQIFGRKMIRQERKGSIINISSVSSHIPLSRVITYSASKAGVNNVTQYLARELAPYDIRVNAIVPGFFPAEQNRKILTEDRVQAIMRHTPMKRFGDPSELKGVTVWLASEKASSFVTGAIIPVDGGFSSMTI